MQRKEKHLHSRTYLAWVVQCFSTAETANWRTTLLPWQLAGLPQTIARTGSALSQLPRHLSPPGLTCRNHDDRGVPLIWCRWRRAGPERGKGEKMKDGLIMTNGALSVRGFWRFRFFLWRGLWKIFKCDLVVVG